MKRPPAGCWSCGAVPSPEDIALRAVLHPREESEGGPFLRIACRACRVEAILEEDPGRDPVLAPPEAAGAEVPGLAAWLEGRRGLEERRRARRWMERWGTALEILRAERALGGWREEAPPPRRPPPRGGRRGTGAPPPPPPARGSRPAGPGLPSTPAEARQVLGVDAGAGRREIDAAFRKASRKCHPDLVAHLDEDFQRLAHGKFLRLKRAHEILTR